MLLEFGPGWREVLVEGGWRVTIPANWEQRPGSTERGAGWVASHFVKQERLWFGAATPLEVKAWVVCGEPGAAEDGLNALFADVLDHSMRFPEFGSCQEGDMETWFSHGAYQISSLHDPKKVTFVRAIDRARGLGLAARVYQRKINHEKLRDIRLRFFRTAVRETR
ncbi:MAG: hypothetical protein JNK87_09535 [Bryobacterales bacterium]|nr:hypothetical protein [Bryobacterales bacterium]